MLLGRVHLDIARANPTSPDLNIAIRNELRALREEAEKFRFWLPEGVGISPEELAHWWISLDYTGRTTIPPEGLAAAEEASESKEGRQTLALDKKFEAELRSRADVPGIVSKLRKMAAMGNMEQGRVTHATSPDTSAGLGASSLDPVGNTTVEQQPLDNANRVTPHALQDQTPQSEGVNSTVLPSTPSNARPDPIASAEENSIALGQGNSVVAEITVENGLGTVGFVQTDLPSPSLKAEGGAEPGLIHSTADVNVLPTCELVGSPVGSDPEIDNSSLSGPFITSAQYDLSEASSTSGHSSVLAHSATEHLASVPEPLAGASIKDSC